MEPITLNTTAIPSVLNLATCQTRVVHCTCKMCGNPEALVDTDIVLTSIPPQYNYYCPKCEYHGFIFCDEVSGERGKSLDKTQEDLEELIKKVKDMEDRVDGMLNRFQELEKKFERYIASEEEVSKIEGEKK